MLTCRSPKQVLVYAWQMADFILPNYRSQFSRHDFTLPQLFACLVLREHQRKSYRDTELLLQDCPDWQQAIGLEKAPDHNTLCRAFHLLLTQKHVHRMLDLLAHWAGVAGLLGQTLAIDGTYCDVHYRSRHYEQRCRKYASHNKEEGNARRSQSTKSTPKLVFGADTASHLVLAAQGHTGMGSDCARFGASNGEGVERGGVERGEASNGDVNSIAGSAVAYRGRGNRPDNESPRHQVG